MRWIAHTAVNALVPVAEAADAVAGALPGAPRRKRSSLRHTAHRPWLVPARPWVMGQSWCDLLFAHWPVPVEQVRAHVPNELDLDLRDGEAWISVTPFEVRGTRPRGTLPPPLLSRFPELNVRTYVTVADRPGIWFFSLDAASALAVTAARALYRLPYFRARMRIDGAPEQGFEYHSARDDPRGGPAVLRARYRPLGGHRHPAPGSLEAWLVERYRLYTVDDGRVYAADIHHRPWTLQDADAEIAANTMTAPLGIELAGDPVVQYAARQDVVFWPLVRIEAG
jgi:uncharacterized protein YqjF (DUF2071 family)